MIPMRRCGAPGPRKAADGLATIDIELDTGRWEGKMQIARSATSVSWIPSDSIPGLLKLPMEKGLMHYDPPPPLTVTDLDPMRRRGEFRFANILRAWIYVEDGTIRDYGYAGGVIMGLTPVTAGPLRVMLPAK